MSLVLLPLAAAATASAAAPPGRAIASADRQLLTRILAETGVQRSLPEPTWSDYLADLLRAVEAWLGAPLRRWSAGGAAWLEVAAWVVLASVVIALVLLLLRWVLSARRRRVRSTPSIVLAAEPEPPRERPAGDREGWRAEIERRLRAGQVEPALEAVWWWLAHSLLAQTVDPAWTSRELLAAAGRHELSPLAATLDRMIYGTQRPSVPDVHGLVIRLEEALA